MVELVGRRTRDEIRTAFARADVFVAPANLESFGIAALEARCAGLPVVAMARTGIREFVANGREGLLAQSDRDMVEQLLRLIRDPELRQRIATHNRDGGRPTSTGPGWCRPTWTSTGGPSSSCGGRRAGPPSAAPPAERRLVDPVWPCSGLDGGGGSSRRACRPWAPGRPG